MSTFWNGVEKGQRCGGAGSDAGSRKSGRALNSAQLKTGDEGGLKRKRRDSVERLYVSVQHVWPTKIMNLDPVDLMLFKRTLYRQELSL
jgi:hypothetical protein